MGVLICQLVQPSFTSLAAWFHFQVLIRKTWKSGAKVGSDLGTGEFGNGWVAFEDLSKEETCEGELFCISLLQIEGNFV